MGIRLVEGENILKEGAANHFKGLERVGGKLWLTNLRLCFRSHALNFQAHEESYLLENIIAVLPRQSRVGLLIKTDNGLTIDLKNGEQEKFVVNGQQDWIASIMRAKKNLPSGNDDPAQKLKALKRLLDAGLINDADYNTKKAEILSRM